MFAFERFLKRSTSNEVAGAFIFINAVLIEKERISRAVVLRKVLWENK